MTLGSKIMKRVERLIPETTNKWTPAKERLVREGIVILEKTRGGKFNLE
jgi:hypothetical protein